MLQSAFFSSMFENADTGGQSEGSSDDCPIKLEGITTFEMDSFLTVLEARYVL